jgi:hypothetical protein
MQLLYINYSEHWRELERVLPRNVGVWWGCTASNAARSYFPDVVHVQDRKHSAEVRQPQGRFPRLERKLRGKY